MYFLTSNHVLKFVESHHILIWYACIFVLSFFYILNNLWCPSHLHFIFLSLFTIKLEWPFLQTYDVIIYSSFRNDTWNSLPFITIIILQGPSNLQHPLVSYLRINRGNSRQKTGVTWVFPNEKWWFIRIIKYRQKRRLNCTEKLLLGNGCKSLFHSKLIYHKHVMMEDEPLCANIFVFHNILNKETTPLPLSFIPLYLIMDKRKVLFIIDLYKEKERKKNYVRNKSN